MNKIIWPKIVQNKLIPALLVGGIVGLWGILMFRKNREPQRPEASSNARIRG